MSCCCPKYKVISLFKGDDTDFNGLQFLTFNFKVKEGSSFSFEGFTARFEIGDYSFTDDISDGEFVVSLSREITENLDIGKYNGVLTIIDPDGKEKTIENEFPFFVTNEVFEPQDEQFQVNIIDTEIKELVEVDVVLGQTGNYENLTNLPSLNGVQIIGDKTSADYGIPSQTEIDELEQELKELIGNEQTQREQAISELDAKVDGINVNLTQQITELEADVDGKYEELTRDIDDLADVVEEDFTKVNTRITEVASELEQTIEENVVALQQEDTALQNQINTHSQQITQEIADRQSGDNALQEQVNDNASAIQSKQDIIEDLETIRSNAQAGYDIIPQVNSNTQRIEDLTISKFPNVVIVGTPHIEGGQVSNFSDTNYLQFPFIDISRGMPFDIYFSFTTSADITNQQNILDSYFGIALAIQNGKGIMALSSNGTNWDIGMATGTNNLLPNTTYYVKYSWTGTAYSASLSTDDQTYVPDMNLTSSLSPHKTTIFIGGSPNLFGASSAHPFKGTINFNKSKVVVNNIVVWEGMADVGLASRANVSLTNLDEVGENRFEVKQNITDNALATADKTIVGAVNELDAKIKDIQLFKFPDATIIGTPVINNGQVSGFSSNNYLILPFAFDTKDRAFEINMAFTTGSNVSTTQNLLGGQYCIALLIEGGVLKFRASNNGTNWNVADITTTLSMQPSTNYFVKIEFNKLEYKVLYSTNGEDFIQVGYKVSTEVPRHGQVFIGVGNNRFNPFLGIINLNRCNIKLNTSIVWQGMDDAGLATRADISLSNLDEIGQAKFDAKQDVGDYATRTELNNGLATKQNKLIAGQNITIDETTNTISATGGGVIPDNVFTTDNLKGGKGIEIVETGIKKIVTLSGIDNGFVESVDFLNPQNDLWEIRTSFKLSQGDADNVIYDSTPYSGYGVQLKVNNSNRLFTSMGNSDGWILDTYGNTYIETNKQYWVRYLYDGNQYKVLLSTTGFLQEESLEISTISSRKMTGNTTEKLRIGRGSPRMAWNAYFRGEIYLSDTLITIGNNTFFDGSFSRYYTLQGNPTITEETIGEKGNYVINSTLDVDALATKEYVDNIVGNIETQLSEI